MFLEKNDTIIVPAQGTRGCIAKSPVIVDPNTWFSVPTSIYWADFIGVVVDGCIGRWAYQVPAIVMSVLSAFIFVTSPLFHAAGSRRPFPHFAVEEMEAQRGEWTCPRSYCLTPSTKALFKSSDAY